MPITRIYSPLIVNSPAQITFTPMGGGPSINLGQHMLPYDLNMDPYYGIYTLYFPAFGITCYLNIHNDCDLTINASVVVVP